MKNWNVVENKQSIVITNSQGTIIARVKGFESHQKDLAIAHEIVNANAEINRLKVMLESKEIIIVQQEKRITELAEKLLEEITGLIDNIESRAKERASIEEIGTTTLENEVGLLVCQKCRGVVPPQMAKYVYYYCPSCGRKVER